MKIQWKKVHPWKSTRVEYFFSLLLVSLLIITVLGSSFYLYFTSVLRNETIQSNNNILAQLRNSQEFILSEVEKSFAGIIMDPLIASYMSNYKSRNILLLQASQKKLESVVVSNEYIDSIHIYYIGDDFVLSSKQGLVNTSGFYDMEFIQEIARVDPKRSYFKTRVMQDYYSKEQIRVLSFINYIPIYFVDKPNAIVVVNIKSVYLQNVLDSIKTKEDSNIVITDLQGEIISNKTGLGLPDANSLNAQLSANGDKSGGWYTGTIDGRKNLISFLYSDRYQWCYISTVPMSTITSSIQPIRVIAIVICLLAVVLGIIGSFLLSGKLYSPIHAISSLLRDENKIIASNDISSIKETLVIQKSISSLIDHNKSLEGLLSDYKLYQKNMFLESLLKGERESDGKLQERLAYYGVDLSMEGCFIACEISMDGYAEFSKRYSEKQQNLFSIYMNENVASTVFQQYKGFIAEVGPNRIILVMNGDAKPESFKTNCYNLARQIHLIVSENIKQTFTIGVSLPHEGIDQLCQCCIEADMALKHKLLLGNNQIILYENVEIGERGQAIYPFSIEKNILNSLKIGAREKVMDYLDEFADDMLVNNHDNLRLVRNFFLQLLSASVKCIYEMDSDFELQKMDRKDIFSVLLEEETMDGMVAHLKKIYEFALQATNEKRRRKNKKMVEMVMKYIQSNLNAEFSIEKLADEFYISVSNIRRIFKEETNSTLKDYVNEQRMKRAKELMEKQDIKISEVAEDIGYLSTQAFTAAFKLYTGQTPSEYKAQCLLKSKSEYK